MDAKRGVLCLCCCIPLFLLGSSLQQQVGAASQLGRVYVNCLRNSTSLSSTFTRNVNTALRNFTNLSSQGTRYATTIFGSSGQDRVYAAFQCRGDLSLQLCWECMQNATIRLPQRDCPNSVEARIQLDGCFLRYGNQSFFELDTTFVQGYCYAKTSDVVALTTIQTLVDNVTSQASKQGGFASDSANDEYAAAQCLGYLNQSECGQCLSSVPYRTVCDSTLGEQVHLASCYYRPSSVWHPYLRSLYYLDMAEPSNRREREDDTEEEAARKERARRAFTRLQSLSTGMDAAGAGRAAQRLSDWANPTHLQWKEVNTRVTTEQIRSIWTVSDGEAKKGRWKVSKCTDQGIRDNAERIALEVFGQPLHNADAPLYFAKMLYMHFIQKEPVDFSSKEPKHLITDIRSQSVTITREELKLALEGSSMALAQETEVLKKRIEEMAAENQRILASQTPPQVTHGIADNIRSLSERMDVMSRRMPRQNLTEAVLHPSLVLPADMPALTSGVPCPECMDPLTGMYMLPCQHVYHLTCLLKRMSEAMTCGFCGEVFPQAMYRMFQMAAPGTESSAARNLHFSNLNDDGASQMP